MVLGKKFWMGIFDSMLVKYGAVLVGYSILGLPVFGPGSKEYINKLGTDESKITRDYVRNSSLLINLSKAIGKIVTSYKELQSLSGYTYLVHEVKQVIDDLDKGTYQRDMIKKFEEEFDIKQRGKYEIADYIRFENVPIISPNGDILIRSINFEVK